MARKRQIDPDIWTSEQVITLPIEARLLFIGMISQADDEGRLRGSVLSLKASVFPVDNCGLDQIKDWRDKIIASKLAKYYEVEGSEYIWLPTFGKYQYMTKRFPSKLPIPPSGIPLETTSTKPVNDELITNDSPLYGIGIEDGNDNEVGDGKESNHLTTILLTLPQWGDSQIKNDEEWLKEFTCDFPEFSADHVKACRDYHSGKTKHTKAAWKNRLRNWMIKAKEIRKERSESLDETSDPAPVPQNEAIVKSLDAINEIFRKDLINERDAKFLGGFQLESNVGSSRNLYRVLQCLKGHAAVNASTKQAWTEELTKLGVEV